MRSVSVDCNSKVRCSGAYLCTDGANTLSKGSADGSANLCESANCFDYRESRTGEVTGDHCMNTQVIPYDPQEGLQFWEVGLMICVCRSL